MGALVSPSPESLAEFKAVCAVPKSLPEMAEHLARQRGLAHCIEGDIRYLQSLPVEKLDCLMLKGGVSSLVVLRPEQNKAILFRKGVLTPLWTNRNWLPESTGFLFRVK